MVSYLRNIIHNVTVSKSFPVPDTAPKELYESIDFTRAVIGGSYALKQFSGDSWKPNDMDVFIACGTKEEFEEFVQSFQEKMKARLVDEVWRDTNGTVHRSGNIRSGSRGVRYDSSNSSNCITPSQEEKFASQVMGVNTYRIDNMKEEIQFVWLDKSQGTVGEILTDICDTPGCVSYRVSKNSDGKHVKTFEVPERALEFLMTRFTPRIQSHSRSSKYSNRGYSFY
jgi:hypothetical protein